MRERCEGVEESVGDGVREEEEEEEEEGVLVAGENAGEWCGLSEEVVDRDCEFLDDGR